MLSVEKYKKAIELGIQQYYDHDYEGDCDKDDGMIMILGVDDTKFEVHGSFLLLQPQDILLYVRVQNLEVFQYIFSYTFCHRI